MSWMRYATGATLAAVGGLAARYAIHPERLERSWLARIDQRLSAIGEVERSFNRMVGAVARRALNRITWLRRGRGNP